MGFIINRYKAQNYTTLFNQETGSFIRIEDQGASEPFWCHFGPELMDISITNWCDLGCNFCYKGSNENGIHMALGDYEMILKQASKMKVSQIALGGGNPNQHPDFVKILELTREKYNIVPSYTTNGKGLSNEVIRSTEKHCGAVAVSAYDPFINMELAIKKLNLNQIRTNIHFLLTSKSIDTAISWLTSPPEFFEAINAIIFLTYKPVGYSPSDKLLANKHSEIRLFFDLISEHDYVKIGFDSCTISGISKFLDVNPVFVECCEAGRFSLYISEDLKIYPCSFMINRIPGTRLTENNLQKVWRLSPEFHSIRNKIKTNDCGKCNIYDLCQGGCPVFPEINYC